jgi:hypothetical protein
MFRGKEFFFRSLDLLAQLWFTRSAAQSSAQLVVVVVVCRLPSSWFLPFRICFSFLFVFSQHTQLQKDHNVLQQHETEDLF